MAAKTTTFNNVAGLNKALRKLPKIASAELRDASGRIAVRVAGKARGKAMSVGGVAALVAPTIRAGRDRVPLIRMGSAKRLPARNGKARTGKNQTIGAVIWGAEWGSTRFTQFAPWSREGRFLYPTVAAESDETMAEYSSALLDALKQVK